MFGLVERAYWNAYRHFSPVDRKVLNHLLLRLSTPRDAETKPISIKTGIGRGLLWQHVEGYSNNFWTGIYDHEMQGAMSQYLSPGGVFYDIGANAGFHGLLAAHLVGKEGMVYCFEPLPENIKMVQTQMDINNIKWWELIPCAVSNEPGTTEFFVGDVNSMASLVQSDDMSNSIKVDLITLDSFVEDHRPPTLVKLDIEGAEGMALQGAQQMLERGIQPVFVIEYHGESCVKDVDDVLSQHNYRYFTLSNQPISVDRIDPLSQVIAKPA